MAFREQLSDACLEDPEVGAGVVSGLRTGMTGDPQELSDLQLTVLSKLAEQPHRSVLEVGEGAVGRAGAPESFEPGEGVGRQVDRCQTCQETCVRELGDLGRQQSPGRVLVTLVPAEPREVTKVRRESRDVRRFGKVSRAGNEEGTTVGAFRLGIDVRPPCPERRPVGSLVSRFLPQLFRIGLEIEESGVRREWF